MRVARIKIVNFRGIVSADLLLPANVVFVGDNNSGKSTVLEAIDLSSLGQNDSGNRHL